MAEVQSDHRRSMEKIEINETFAHMKRRNLEAKIGQVFAFTIAIFAIGVGAYASLHGSHIFDTAISLSGLASIVYAFIQGRKNVKS